MRWRTRDYGITKQIIKRFALFPHCLKDEWRWLETFYVLQERLPYNVLWCNMRWATKEEYLAWKETQ